MAFFAVKMVYHKKKNAFEYIKSKLSYGLYAEINNIYKSILEQHTLMSIILKK